MSGGTHSLRLIRIDADMGRILEADRAGFERMHGASPGEHVETVRQVVAQTLALLARAPREAPWGGYLAVDDGRGQVVGTCGFKHGPEKDGSVEIAYFTFPGFERRGYATAMARELLDLALNGEGVRQVIAFTLPESNASTRVLRKVGMRWTGEVLDPEDGRIWRWEHTRAAAPGIHAGRLAPCPSSPNCVSSDARDDGHGIAPLTLSRPSGEAWRVLCDAVRGLPRVKVITETSDYLHAECRSAVFRFVDDLELQLRSAEGIIAVRSGSRLGHWDLGVNRRRVDRLRAMLSSTGLFH